MRVAPPSSEPLREPLLRAIAAEGGVRHFPANTILIHEGDQADSMFIILGGRVKIYASSANGKEVVLNTQGPGEFFGEMALDGEVRSASVITLEPTTCAIVAGSRLREFLAAHPDFAMQVIERLIERVRMLSGKVRDIALENVHCRVLRLLDRLAEPQGEHRVIRDKLTQQDIANRVGASREMISRVFKDLGSRGYVEVKGSRITVLKALPEDW